MDKTKVLIVKLSSTLNWLGTSVIGQTPIDRGIKRMLSPQIDQDMTNILVIEDNLDLAQSLKSFLKKQNYSVELAHNGDLGLECLLQFNFELAIIDWNLPGKEGPEVCREYRAKGGNTPILMLTGRREAAEIESGLDSGADDYLTKPFDLRVLNARVRALLRRTPQIREDTLRLGSLEINRTTRELINNGEEIYLQPKEFAVFELLMRHKGQVLSSEALLDRVWTTESESGVDTVRTVIKKLRQKLAVVPEVRIRTVYASGYRLELD